MTLGQCLDEIRKIYFEGNMEAMARMGMDLIYEIKYDYYHGAPFPRHGWFLLLSENEVSLVNGQVKVPVNLTGKRPPLTNISPWPKIHHNDDRPVGPNPN